LFFHWQKTCGMIRFAFLASQVYQIYQTHVIETRQTITSFLHLVPSFIQNNRLIPSIFPSFIQDNRLPPSFLVSIRTIACLLPSFLSSLSLYSCLGYFTVPDQCISLSLSPLFPRIDRSIRLSWKCAIECQNPKQTSKQNQANLQRSLVIAPHLLVQSSPVQSSPVQSSPVQSSPVQSSHSTASTYWYRDLS
jgi:hypothetical protein